VVTDVASGLNEKRGDLQRLLDMAIKHKIDVVVVKSRDRSTRFGFEYLAEVHKDKKRLWKRCGERLARRFRRHLRLGSYPYLRGIKPLHIVCRRTTQPSLEKP